MMIENPWGRDLPGRVSRCCSCAWGRQPAGPARPAG